MISYFGLVPSVRRSANTVHYGRITKVGDSLPRYLLVEAAVTHVSTITKRDSSTPLSEFYRRLALRRGGSKAKVATAAKMLTMIYWMLHKQIDFDTCIAQGRQSTAREPRKKHR